jgi:hypothetical protein
MAAIHAPAALLQAAARVLEARRPQAQASFHLDGFRYRARFDWPGVVSVFNDADGMPLARSKPGRPLEVDAAP